MSSVTPCETLLLEDVPAPQDAFGTPEQPGAHHRVARAIAELIESTDGGKVIGLEGGWGAGKSTVVGIVRALLDRDAGQAKHLVVAFDAWAHEGDPLRRTYLETLIRALQERKWIDRERWDGKLEEIANRRRVTSTRTVPKTTQFGTLLALSLLFVPVGAPFMTAALREGVTIDLTLPIAWNFWIGSLCAAPLLVLLVRLLWLVCRRPFDLRCVADPDAWAFLEGKAISTTQTETTETPNPTSLEFEAYFDALMKEALDNTHDRRVVLVLDNLDRVDPKEALAIWSTLQTFLQHHHRRCEAWFRRLWIVVPFDPSGLRKLWEIRRSGDDATNAGVGGAVAESFLEKSFQVRFCVPPLVLSDWKTHLMRLFSRALPRHAADQHAVYRVFEQFRPRLGDPPTPRELTLFVNQIGAIHRQWHDDFPLAHVAYFVLACGDRREFIDKLRAASLPASEAVRMLGGELRDNLAGLVFNVSATRGREILLADPIYEALIKGEVEEFNRLAGSHDEGFWLTLEHVAQTKFFGAHGSIIARIALTLDQSQLLSTTVARPEAHSVLHSLRAAARTVGTDQWGVFDDALARGLASLCRLECDEVFTREVLHRLRALPFGASDAADGRSSEPQALIENLLTLIRAVEELNHSDALPQQFALSVDTEGWKAACQALVAHDAEGRYWRRIRPALALGDVLKVLQAAIGAGQCSSADLALVDVTYDLQAGGDWEALINVVRDRLHPERGIGSPESVVLLRLLWTLRRLKQPAATGVLTMLVETGQCMHYFQRAVKANDVPAQAFWALTFLMEAPDGQKRGTIGNSEAGHQRFVQALGSGEESLVGELAQLVRETGEIQWLFASHNARGRHEPLFAACLTELVRHDSDHQLISTEIVLHRWNEIRGAFIDVGQPAEFAAYIQTMARDADLCVRLQAAQGGFASEHAVLYDAIAADSAQVADTFADWCAVGLREIKTEAWISDLAGPFDCVKLALNLRRRGVSLELGLSFADALIEHAGAVAAGAQIPAAELQTEWHHFPDRLRPDAVRSRFPKRLMKVATKHEGNLHEVFFVLYGDTLIDIEALVSSDDVVSVLFSNWVKDEGPLHALRWMHRVFEAFPQFWERIKTTAAAEEFALRLRDRLEGDPTEIEARQLLREIAARLGLMPPEPVVESAQLPHADA